MFKVGDEVFKIRAAKSDVVLEICRILVENGILEGDVEKVARHLGVILEVDLLFFALLVASAHEHAV